MAKLNLHLVVNVHKTAGGKITSVSLVDVESLPPGSLPSAAPQMICQSIQAWLKWRPSSPHHSFHWLFLCLEFPARPFDRCHSAAAADQSLNTSSTVTALTWESLCVTSCQTMQPLPGRGSMSAGWHANKQYACVRRHMSLFQPYDNPAFFCSSILFTKLQYSRKPTWKGTKCGCAGAKGSGCRDSIKNRHKPYPKWPRAKRRG